MQQNGAQVAQDTGNLCGQWSPDPHKIATDAHTHAATPHMLYSAHLRGMSVYVVFIWRTRELTFAWSELARAFYNAQVVVDETLVSDIRSMTLESAETVNQRYPEGSFERIFWDQQQKAAAVRAQDP